MKKRSRKYMIRTSLFLVLCSLVLLPQLLLAAADGPLSRDQVAEEYKWNLQEIYQDNTAWEQDFALVKEELLPKLVEFEGKLNRADRVLACFKLQEEISRRFERVYLYAFLKADENQADSKATEMFSRVLALGAELAKASAYVRPELLALPEKTLRAFLKRPDFQDYRFSLEAMLKEKAHTLSKAEEKLLAAVGELASAPSQIYDKLSTADLKFPKIKDAKGQEIQLSHGVYGRIVEDPDRELRKQAFEGMYQPYEACKHTYAQLLNTEVKSNVIFARTRKYGSALEAALAGEDIPVAVFDNLIKAVNQNLPSLHRYVELRRQVLGLEKVHNYDMFIPLVEEYKKTVPYEEAKRMVLEGLQPLGEEYAATLRQGFASRWIDVYETKNKATGGYQIGIYDLHPYVLLNYNDTVNDMLTLAHEMGHALNSYYTNKTQPYAMSGNFIFTAEVASTANELLMLKYLIKNAASDEERLYFLNYLAEQIRGTVYIQVMYSEFEKAIHERVEQGEALSVDSLNALTRSLLEKYYGPGYAIDDLGLLWWSRIPHFYRNFYVYKYATAMAAANELVKQMEEGGNPQRYLEFLKAGTSDYPINILKKAGVDMTTTEPVDNLLKEFAGILDEMEAILKKQGKIR